MKNIIMGIYAFTLIFISTSSYADTHCDNNSCTGKIKRVYPTNNGDVYFELHDISSAASALSCSLVENIYFKLEKNHDNKREIYSIAVSAAFKEFDIRFRLNDTGDCGVSYVMLDNL